MTLFAHRVHDSSISLSMCHSLIHPSNDYTASHSNLCTVTEESKLAWIFLSSSHQWDEELQQNIDLVLL